MCIIKPIKFIIFSNGIQFWGFVDCLKTDYGNAIGCYFSFNLTLHWLSSCEKEFLVLVSTKGRYALRVMIDLAHRMEEDYIPLRDIADRLGLSQKYLEAIFKPLNDAGLVSGMRGKNGGYKLARNPAEITILDVLDVTEGGVAPVSCLRCNAKPCENESSCDTLDLWKGLYSEISEYLSNYTLQCLMDNSTPGVQSKGCN